MVEIYKSLSVRLYDVMEHVGASEEMRQLHQSTAIHAEIINTMMNQMENLNVQTYIFGSFMEGTTTLALRSDIDMLQSHDSFPVHEYIADAGDGESFLMVRDVDTRPGYAKLQHIMNGIPLTVHNCYKKKNVESDRNGRIVCKKEIFDDSDERNGPATTHRFGDMTIDAVYAYRCSSIPRIADEWTKQKFKFNWPLKQMLDNMTSSGCFFVGVGHPASDEKHLEWRLSLSLLERDLMLSFNPTQHKCYILLKMVKKDIIVRRLDTCISSYHMKTCMFYIIQNTRKELWKPDNLCRCLRLCLKRLLKWVNCEYCPNYFIREENMFDRDVHRKVKLQLSDLLNTLINAGPKILLSNIDCDNINQYLEFPELLSATSAAVENHRRWLCRYSFGNEWLFRRSLLSYCKKNKDCTSLCLFLNNQLNSLQNTSTYKRKPDNYYRQALFRIKTYFQYQIGCICMSIAFHVGETITKDGFLKLAEHHFQKGQYCDKTSSRLMYATVLYKTEHYESCVRLLQEIKAELGHFVVSSCSCHAVDFVEEPTQQPSSFANTASCVVFLPSSRIITPALLLPEMSRSVDTPLGSREEEKDFWFDCAAVDGKVYLYFLKYLVYSKLDQHVQKQVAFDNMKMIADYEPNLGHRDTAYNLLGWILVQENRIIDGIRYLVKSWKIRPIHNAAKWHLGIAVFKQTTQNKVQQNQSKNLVVNKYDLNKQCYWVNLSSFYC